ncbi:NADAR family protein [Ferruginibacter sp.]
MNYSINWLKTQIENGFQPEYLFFWGHKQKAQGIVDKSCFSQWWPAPFMVDGITYATAEHWMMAKKALLFDDQEQFQNVLSTNDPAEAKNFGRSVKNFDAEKWNAVSFDLVTAGNFHKFSQHKTLKDFLLVTANKIIVEASPVDFIWGIGLSQNDTAATDPFKWKGPNLLGFALMQVRDKLKEQ